MKAEILLISSVVLAACVPAEGDGLPTAPEPIGAELLSITVPALGLNGCVEAHIYRAKRAVQYQCFDPNGTFSWENRGTLSSDGEAALEDALAVTDFENTEPAPDNGWCGNPDSDAVSMTLWMGEQSFTYKASCPTMGIAELHEIANTLIGDISDCNEPGTVLDLLESVEPGCRQY